MNEVAWSPLVVESRCEDKAFIFNLADKWFHLHFVTSASDDQTEESDIKRLLKIKNIVFEINRLRKYINDQLGALTRDIMESQGLSEKLFEPLIQIIGNVK